MSHSDEHIGVGIHCLFLLVGSFRNLRLKNKQKEVPRFLYIHGSFGADFPQKQTSMKNTFILICALLCSLQTMAVSLVIEHRSGADLLQDIATIGKWVFVEDELQLLDRSGSILATESIAEIKKITFAVSGPATNMESVQSNAILVYPNPTQDVLMIQGVAAQTLRVYDLQGRLISTTNGTQVDVAHLADGTYLLQVGTQIIRFIKK